MAGAATVQGESLIATRNLRVAVGDGHEVVDVERGQDWPTDARARLDVLIRVGHVVRFDEDGVPDKRSRPFLKRLGMRAPPRYQTRTFEQRARAEAQKVAIAGRRVRVFAGRQAEDLGDLFVTNGRAYVLRRGTPDGAMAVEARSASKGGTSEAPRRRPGGNGKAPTKKRRRKRQRG